MYIYTEDDDRWMRAERAARERNQDVSDKVQKARIEVALEIFEEIEKFIKAGYELNGKIIDENKFIDLENCKHEEDIAYGKYCVLGELEDIIAELKKKYAESGDNK